MKRETLRHPKAYELAASLGCSRPEALGYLTLLWDYCGEVAPQGDIGKWTNGAIALACDWKGDPDRFVGALVANRWLDDSEPYRLIVHDWPDHCERWVKAKLDRAELSFLPAYSRCAHEARTPDALSNPIQSNPIQSEPGASEPHRCRPGDDGTEWGFPLASSGDSPDWVLPVAKRDEYAESYPHLDLETELRKARQWLRDNPAKRRTGQRGMLQFLTRWLNRAQNSGGGRVNGSARSTNADAAAEYLARRGVSG